jgi:hypothetical protein
MTIVAAAAGIAPNTAGPWPATKPKANAAPARTTTERKTEYRRTRNESSVRAADAGLRPARRSAHTARAMPPAPAVGSNRVAAAPVSVICALSRMPILDVARPATSDMSAT